MAALKTYSYLRYCLAIIWLLATMVATSGLCQAVEIRYSRGFTVKQQDGVTLICVKRPWPGATSGFNYLLKPRGCKTPPGYDDFQVVDVPVHRIVALSPTYLAFIDRLKLTKELVGFSELSHIFTESVKKAAAQGEIVNVGRGNALQIETVLSLEPELIFTYATGGFRDLHPKLLEAGLKVAVCGEYVESHPLGRAEWIKFIGLFFEREAQAEQIFNAIEKRYLKLAALTRNVTYRPTVITNVPRNGYWGVSGGNSFVSRFLEDAGAEYIWRDLKKNGAVPMAVELVYDRGLNADFWLNTWVWTTLEQARQADPRYRTFKALQQGHLFNQNRRVNAKGGNDFWETGIIEPEVILADLIHIFHPELLPEHKFVYYQKLK